MRRAIRTRTGGGQKAFGKRIGAVPYWNPVSPGRKHREKSRKTDRKDTGTKEYRGERNETGGKKPPFPFLNEPHNII